MNPPRTHDGGGFPHHGGRALLLVLVAAAVTSFLPAAPGPTFRAYEVGVVAGEDVIAEITFGVPKNAAELARERNAAAAAVPPTYRFEPDAPARMTEALVGFYESAAAAAAGPQPDAALDRLLAEAGLALSPAQRTLLRNAEARRVLTAASTAAVADLLPRGVVGEAGPIEPAVAGRILVLEADGGERFTAPDSVLSTRQFFTEATRHLPANAGSELNELFRIGLIRFMVPSLRFDDQATGVRREAAQRAVPIYSATILQGEAIVRANQQVGEEEAARLAAYEDALRALGRLEPSGVAPAGVAATLALNLLVLTVLGFLLYLYRPDVYGDTRWLLLLAGLILAFAAAAGAIARNDLPAELLPIAFVSLSIAVLWDGRLALIVATTLAVLIGVQAPFEGVEAWLPVFVAGSAAGLAVRAVRRRAQTWIFIAIIVAAYAAVLGSLGLLADRPGIEVLESIAWASGNSVVSAILAMGFLPVFEWFARITTDQTLLEWADPNTPLLKRLSMEAPGTYAHTINLANLAESAANAIDANGLLCRVGVYYHDVGKVLKPHYFIENQIPGRNPHDRMKPAASAAIVREHVTEGIKLAEAAKLPEVLVQFIPEHHGTQEISFFYERAKAEAGGGEGVDPAEFRYPGPVPQSKETAIVLLADAVESATRALQDPTPDRIRDLIDSIVDSKIQGGQLDEAPLTFREVGRIQAQFLKVLTSVYHHRLDYPQTRHLTEAPSAEPVGTDSMGPSDATGAIHARRATDAKEAAEATRSATPGGTRAPTT